MTFLLLLACGGASDTPKAPADTGADTSADTDTPADTGPACFADADLDGAGNPAAPAPCGGAASPTGDDCDDTDARVHPAAPEVCNGVDDNCDALIDAADPNLADGLLFWADADGDGYGGDTLVSACSADDAVALVDGDCDDADPTVNPAADEGCTGIDRNCDGRASTEGGSDAECPGDTCATILAEYGGAADDGAYWLALPSGEVAEVWCDMSTDGGGWTLGFLRNTASTGSQADFGFGNEALASVSTSPAAASASAVAANGWIDLNDFSWDTLRVGAYASGAETWLSKDIARSDLRIPFGSDGYYLYGGASGYYWCGGAASYTDSGIGAVDNPAGAPSDCKQHGSLGSGWDFSDSPYANAGLTLCGGDGSYWLYAGYATNLVYYGAAGGAQAIWVR